MRGQQKGANGLTHHIIFTLKLHSGLEIRFVLDIITISAFTPQQAPGLNIYLYICTYNCLNKAPLLFFVDPTLKSVQKKCMLMSIHLNTNFLNMTCTILDFTLSYYWIIALLAATILQSTMFMLFLFYFCPLISAENIKELSISA